MKHVKLFEAWDQEISGQAPAQLLVMGDWTGILINPDKTAKPFEGEFTPPATFEFKYFAPGEMEIPVGYEYPAEEPIADMETIAEEAFGGDQNGANVAPKDYVDLQGDESVSAQDSRNGIVRLFIDPNINPKELEDFLKAKCEEIWGEYNHDVDTVESYDEEAQETFDPAFIEAAMTDQPFPRRVIFA